jgi:signal peptidase I
VRRPAARWCALALAVAGLAWLRRSLLVVSVTGPSMLPAFRPGDRVLVRRQRPARLRPGAVIVFEEPGGTAAGSAADAPGRTRSWVIKRLAAVPGDTVPPAVLPAVQGAPVVPPGMILVLGDGPDSRDSRHWGFVPASRVLGVVVRELSR